MQKEKITIFFFFAKKSSKQKSLKIMLNLRGSQNTEWNSVESA